MDPILGQIIMFGGTFAPQNWAFCNGQLLPISQNQALFSLLGTTYGGDGIRTFALPDLRGRAPIHFGQGAYSGASNYVQGQIGGIEQVAIGASQIPAHVHGFSIACDNNSGDSLQTDPTNNFLSAGESIYSTSQNATMGLGTSTPTGANQPHENRPPFVAMNYIIATAGIYPSRS